MNHLEWRAESPLASVQTLPSQGLPKIITTCILLLIAYYVFPYLAYETTIKRTLYDFTLRITPSWFIYAMQNLALRPYNSGQPFFHRRDLSNPQAKSQALQQIYQESGIPGAVKRARGWSGYDKFVNTASELSFPGLRNWDNSCFQNSILQALASLPDFLRYLDRSSRLCGEAGTEAKTHHALEELLGQLTEGIGRKTSMWPPDVLKSLDTWQQQDAQEYFSKILDTIDKESGSCRKVLAKRLHPGLNCLRFPRYAGSAFHDETLEKLEKKFQELSPSNPIEGMLAQCLRCQKCGYSEGFTFMSFNCLTLNLGIGGTCQVEDLIDEYTVPELIEGVECDGCTRAAAELEYNASNNAGEVESDGSSEARDKTKKKMRSTKEKQITFGRLPNDLVLHINRSIFDEYGNQLKNFAPVGFPSRLKIRGKWCAPIDSNPEAFQAIYELRCITTHSGRHDNGHYIACGKRGKEWYSFNDETVTKISEENVLSRGNVFMLFYERVEHGPILEIPSSLEPEELDDDNDEFEDCAKDVVASDVNGSIESRPIGKVS